MDINRKGGYITCWVCGRPLPKNRAMWIRRGGRYVPVHRECDFERHNAKRVDFMLGAVFTIVSHEKGSGSHEARRGKRR